VSGQPVVYKDIDQEDWISGAVAVGVPADYAVMLRWLTGAIIAGDGSQPTGDIETVTRPAAGQLRSIHPAQRRCLDHSGGQVTKYTCDTSNFGADGPFFHIIREGLQGLADGEDYFDLLADDVVVEYVISVPGYPRRAEGRQAVIDLYSGYDDYMTVRTTDNLRVYRDPEASCLLGCPGTPRHYASTEVIPKRVAADLGALAWKIAYERWSDTASGDDFSEAARRALGEVQAASALLT
jgi:hypothetical protein